jgi:hypothetical protein
VPRLERARVAGPEKDPPSFQQNGHGKKVHGLQIKRKAESVLCVTFVVSPSIQKLHLISFLFSLIISSISSGTVDLNEWNDFLANVQKDRMNFYKTSFLLQVQLLKIARNEELFLRSEASIV